ncbi:clathrin light chain A-like isoform X3 [Histomonas meleagridis]|uniref:clathrin light chain A-like isoform X3 n=1 Tax=Histomonas meleagridis TaxID=135588 RepID=UPI003559390E|nr:clathrin light chain A-like isoform X3 [Histomonas meleagridis]KAH0805038.1 clathrin light chain A-like isoform X3 [Histomonas meleagridis]
MEDFLSGGGVNSIPSNGMDDDLFSGSNVQGSNDNIFSGNHSTNVDDMLAGTNVDDMLAGSDDDDLFAQAPEPQQPQEEAKPTALVEWEKEKQAEIQQLDAKNEAADEEMKNKAKEMLNSYHSKLSEAQAKRAKNNLEVDQQFISGLENSPNNKWEKVVSYIDFNRSDLHQKDIAKMKTLLLQLKQ